MYTSMADSRFVLNVSSFTPPDCVKHDPLSVEGIKRFACPRAKQPF
jgi:hypothetical protein